MNKSKTKSIAFSGIATAIIVILLFIAGIIEVLDYTACAICGLIITFILVEFGTSSAIGVYIASSILSLLIIPSKIYLLYNTLYNTIKKVVNINIYYHTKIFIFYRDFRKVLLKHFRLP